MIDECDDSNVLLVGDGESTSCWTSASWRGSARVEKKQSRTCCITSTTGA